MLIGWRHLCLVILMGGCDSVAPSGEPWRGDEESSLEKAEEPVPHQTPAPRTSTKPTEKPNEKPTVEPFDEPTEEPPKPSDSRVTITVDAESFFKETSFYAGQVRPLLQNSCLAVGCHVDPQYIDLRTYPFPAEGSYAMERAIRELGENADPLAVQKILVEEIIDSVTYLFMPILVDDIDDLEESEIDVFRTWLDRDLFVESFHWSGKVEAQTLDQHAGTDCQRTQEFVMDRTVQTMNMDLCANQQYRLRWIDSAGVVWGVAAWDQESELIVILTE